MILDRQLAAAAAATTTSWQALGRAIDTTPPDRLHDPAMLRALLETLAETAEAASAVYTRLGEVTDRMAERDGAQADTAARGAVRIAGQAKELLTGAMHAADHDAAALHGGAAVLARLRSPAPDRPTTPPHLLITTEGE